MPSDLAWPATIACVVSEAQLECPPLSGQTQRIEAEIEPQMAVAEAA